MSPRRPRKSSACVTLVLIGAALAGCGGDTGSRRSAYASKEECLADWGDPKECEEKPRTSSGARTYGPTAGAWHGYSSGRSSSSSSRSSSSRSSSSSSTSRGGFGSRSSSAS